jgi:hypothetical protein
MQFKVHGLGTFQTLVSEFISPSTHIHSSEGADKAASIASVYRLQTIKATLLDKKYALSDLDHLLKHKTKLRTL